MGYHRDLYVGPVFICRHKENKAVETFNNLNIEEDVLALAQRHINTSHISILIPNKNRYPFRNFNKSIEDDPAFSISPLHIEEEKRWLVDRHSEELNILCNHYESVQIDWMIVIDGG